MSEKTKTAAPAEKGEGRKGGLKNARPEVQALARITGILDRMDDEQRDRTLDLVGQTYDRLSRATTVRSLTVGTMDVTDVMKVLREQLERESASPAPEDAGLAIMRHENERLRQQLRGVQGLSAGSPSHPLREAAEEARKTDNAASMGRGFVHNPKPPAGGYASEEPRGTNRTEAARVG